MFGGPATCERGSSEDCINCAETAPAGAERVVLPGAEWRQPPTSFPNVMPSRESRLPPTDREPGLYYEARRGESYPPGVSHECPVSLPCVSPVNFIGFAYATEATAVCPNSGQF